MTYDEFDDDDEWVEDESDDSDDVLQCPSCRKEVHEDTQQCPHCGDWIEPVYPQKRFKRYVWLVIVVILIATMTLITVFQKSLRDVIETSHSESAAQRDDEPGVVDTELQCPECDYNLTGATGDRCPWCGWVIDIDVLSAPPVNTNIRRLGAIVAATATGIGTIVVAASLAMGGRTKPSIHDSLAILGALVAVAGHFALVVVIIARYSQRWPMRGDDVTTLIRLCAWISIALGIIGATPAFSLTPAPTVRPDVDPTIYGPMEFLIAALFFTLPAWLLLTLCLVSFRRRGESPRRVPARIGRVASETSHAPFLVESFQRLTVNQMTTQFSPDSRPSTPAIEAAIQQTWQAEVSIAEQIDRTLFNGELARLTRAAKTANGLRLELGPTCYRDFVGTNLHNPMFASEHGLSYLSNALGVSAIIVTLDGFLVLGRRSERVASHAGYLHAFGGMVEAEDRTTDGGYDVFACCARELQEELGLRNDEIISLTCIGLVRDRRILQPELLFEANIKLTRDALKSRFRPELSHGEHTNLEWVRAEPDAMLPFLQNSPLFAPVAQAALLLHGRENFGMDWYEQCCYLLYGEPPPTVSNVFSTRDPCETFGQAKGDSR